MAKYIPGPAPSEMPAGCYVLQVVETGYLVLTEHDMESGNTIDLNKIDLTEEYEQV